MFFFHILFSTVSEMSRTELDRFRVKCDAIGSVIAGRNSPWTYILDATSCNNYKQTFMNQTIRYTYCDDASRVLLSPLSFIVFLLALVNWHRR